VLNQSQKLNQLNLEMFQSDPPKLSHVIINVKLVKFQQQIVLLVMKTEISTMIVNV